MPLERVTLTGADDTVDPVALCEMSQEFPFVEWGILLGTAPGHRFPSEKWIERLIEARVNRNNAVRLSLHLCGARLRAVAAGRPDLEDVLGAKRCAFERVQLNWHGERQLPSVSEAVLASFCKMDGGFWDPEIIFQLDGVNDDLWQGAARKFRCAGLFDRSHGAGIKPASWPLPHREIASGWAGGLGPANVRAEVSRIDNIAYPAMNYWIDMETKLFNVRSEFDLSICRDVLNQVKECVGVLN